MTESTEPHPEKERDWPGRLLRIAFFTLAFLLVVFTVMANMGGSNENLKVAIEDFFTGTFGYTTHVGTLNRMSFFPTISMDIEDIQMNPAGEADPVITIGRIDCAMGFWDVTFSTGKVKKFNIEDFSALPGTLLRQPVIIDRVGIEEDQGDLAFFGIHGRIGSYPVSFQADMRASGPSGKRKYIFAENRPFAAAAGDIGIEGTFARVNDSIEIGSFTLTMPEKILGGNLYFAPQGQKKIRIRGDIETVAGSKMKPDLSLRRERERIFIEGKIESEMLQAKDLAGGGRLAALVTMVKEILGMPRLPGGGTDWSNVTLDVDVSAAAISGAAHSGPVAAKVTVTDGRIDWGALSPFVAK